jgi:hypothetical protein
MWLSPAVCTSEITGIDVWCHLHATMTFDSVEGALVAGTIGNQALFSPMANLHSTVFAD